MANGLNHASCTSDQRAEKDAYGFLDLVHPSKEWEARGRKAAELLVGKRCSSGLFQGADKARNPHMSSPPTNKITRTLGWATANGELVRVCDMDNIHLMSCIQLSRRRIMAAKLTTGVTSLSFLAYQYLLDEAKERGIISTTRSEFTID